MDSIKIGIFGLNRGMELADSMIACGADIVAICDGNLALLAKAQEKLGPAVTGYTKFDDFIKHEMDAVFLANCFHEHAPYAILCLEKGLHVLSECTAAGTMADCVALVRAAEKSTAKYMLLENYPFMLFNREIKRICDGGSLGKILYAEGEYNHPPSSDSNNIEGFRRYIPYDKHWRNYNPRTYYITHSLAPLMYATGAEPVRVTAMPVCAPGYDAQIQSSRCSDRAAIITCLNNDGSVFKVTGNAAFGAAGNSYRVCGIHGQVENIRGMENKVMLRYNNFSMPKNVENPVSLYTPAWDDPDEEKIIQAGHGGGDFIAVRTFLECIRTDSKPIFDVYFATKMSAVGILAHRSLLQKGVPFDIPDFRLEADRKRWEDDTLSPYYGFDGSAPTMPCGSMEDYEPTAEQIARYFAVLENTQ